MEIREYPELESTTVTVTTAYPGASSELIQGFITQPLQQAIAEAKGIDFLSSSSTQGISTIQAQMELNYDANAALAEIQSKVASQRNALPAEAQDPVISSTTGDGRALMYIAFFSDVMEVPQITDYLAREVQPRLQALAGVGKAELLGRRFALRVWLDPTRMAAVDLTSTEVSQALLRNNYVSAVGQTKAEFIKVNLTSNTDVADTSQFENLVIKSTDDAIVRLKDIARVELGSQTYENIALYKGKPSTYVAINLAPGANPLDVAKLVKDLLPDIKSQLPQGLSVDLPYDASAFIDDSINEVIKTLVEAVGIVLVIVFLCLGSLRAAIVPSVAVPLSPDRWRLHHVDTRLLAEPAYAAITGVGNRTGGGRRHHHCGERASSYRRGQVPQGSCTGGCSRDGQSGYCHDDHTRCRLRTPSASWAALSVHSSPNLRSPWLARSSYPALSLLRCRQCWRARFSSLMASPRDSRMLWSMCSRNFHLATNERSLR